MSERKLVIVNPRSANGSTGKEWPEIKRRLESELGPIDSVLTDAPGEATEIARRGVKEGIRTIIGVGGDGTNSEIVNGFFERGELIHEGITYGHIPRGTGCDLPKTLNLSKDLDRAVATLKRGRREPIDLGKITFLKDGTIRYFINVADFGIGGELVARVNRTTKRFGGFVSFALGSVRSILSYKNKKVSLRRDGEDWEEWAIFSVNIANGQYYGGGMRIAPEAKMDDGLLDVILVEEMTSLQALLSMGSLYRGAHLKNPKVHSFRVKSMEADSKESVLLDIDGEQIGSLPARFELLPKVIHILV